METLTNILKAIRIRLAELNDIEYHPHPCNNVEDCIGTCKMCDAESILLLKTLKKKEREGFPVTYDSSSASAIIIESKESQKKVLTRSK